MIANETAPAAVTTTVSVDNMWTAAVFLSKGYEVQGYELVQSEPTKVRFDFAVSVVEQDETETLLRKCDLGLDVWGNIGQYERSFRRVRAMIARAKEAKGENDGG
jgi:hypothetical protein